jgi:serine/threonine-protein kinase RsbW
VGRGADIFSDNHVHVELLAGDGHHRTSMAGPPNLRIALRNRADNVVLVREALTGLAESVKLAGTDLSDVRTAVTEAANNVVVHAYEGEEGPLEVAVVLAPRALQIAIIDHGVGFDGQRDGAAAVGGIGLQVIEALAERVEFSETPGGGTVLVLEFLAPELRPLSSELEERPRTAELVPESDPLDTSAVVLEVSPTSLARHVLPRLLWVLAARASFSTDRISDAQLLGDAVAAHAGGSVSGQRLRAEIRAAPREIELEVGPLAAGRGEHLVRASDLQGLGPVLAKLADGYHARSDSGADSLTLRMLEAR